MAAIPLILLVDDFEDARDLYSEYLAFKGFRVALAGDGVEAIRQAREHRPSLILLDVRMPRLTGIETLHKMRADPRLGEVPIIAFTAHALESEREALLAAGFDAVLAKPCFPEDLAAFISATLDEVT